MFDSVERALLVDIGNSRLKWVVVDGFSNIGALSVQALTHEQSLQCLPQQWQALMAQGVRSVRISHVANESLLKHVRDVLENVCPHVTVAVFEMPTHAQQFACAMTSDYHLSQMGSDRWLQVQGAQCAYPMKQGTGRLVVSLGTAMTMDAVVCHADGGLHHIGGSIGVGAGLMRHTLAQHTARLPAQGGQWLGQRAAQNTLDALQQGVAAALMGSWLYAQVWLQEQTGVSEMDWVMCGGDAQTWLPRMQQTVWGQAQRIHLGEHLCLQGLSAWKLGVLPP